MCQRCGIFSLQTFNLTLTEQLNETQSEWIEYCFPLKSTGSQFKCTEQHCQLKRWMCCVSIESISKKKTFFAACSYCTTACEENIPEITRWLNETHNVSTWSDSFWTPLVFLDIKMENVLCVDRCDITLKKYIAIELLLLLLLYM